MGFGRKCGMKASLKTKSIIFVCVVWFLFLLDLAMPQISSAGSAVSSVKLSNVDAQRILAVKTS